jgi:hypothetical protein
MAWFRNHYRCPQCRRSWSDEWSATCDDDCPHCGLRHVSPTESEDLTVVVEPTRDGAFALLRSPPTAEHSPDYVEVGRFATHAAAEAERGRPQNSERVRHLNDAFRQTFAGGKVVLSVGVVELPDMVKANALLEVARYDRFDADNDPYGEHDFGAFEFVGRRFYWKIDYFDRDMEGGSEDPADPEQTTRVLTLMLADEY